MLKRIVITALALVCVASTFSACTGNENVDKTIQIGDVSVESIDLEIDKNAKVFSSDERFISDALFKYLFIYFKEQFLADAKYYESMGASVTGDENIKVGDTEAFWTCTYEKDEDGNITTMKDFVYQNAMNVAKDIIALEAVADDYSFIYPDDYQTKLEAAIYSDVEGNGSEYLDSDTEFADEDGVVYPWVKARREMYLASKGITAEEWERVFYLYQTVFAANIIQHMEFAGVIEAESDEVLKNTVTEYLEEELKSFLTDNTKLDLLFYQYKNVDKSDTSEEASSHEASDDTSSDELTPEEYNEKLFDDCSLICQNIQSGDLTFEDAAEDADHSDDDAIITNESLKEFFGDDILNFKPGETKLFKVEEGIYILTFKELTEVDFGRTTVPTDSEIKEQKQQSLEIALNKFIEKYKEAIIVDEKLVEKYNRPWEIK